LLDYLAGAGYEPRYGARPLQRAIEALIVTPLARYLVEHPELRDVRLWLDVDSRGRVSIG
jgi:ATP-dependent Clp protease ATP-binding subunit ClpA